MVGEPKSITKPLINKTVNPGLHEGLITNGKPSDNKNYIVIQTWSVLKFFIKISFLFYIPIIFTVIMKSLVQFCRLPYISFFSDLPLCASLCLFLHTENLTTSQQREITQPLHTENHATSPHRKSRKLSTQKITQPLHIENHAISPHRNSSNLSTQKITQPLHIQNCTTAPNSKSRNLSTQKGEVA